MKLYLVRHGDAAHPAVDPTRALTERGRADVARLAAWMATRGVEVRQILHSSKRRAQETAEIIAAALHPPAGVRRVAGLEPNDDAHAAENLLRAEPEPVMAVTHLPLVEYLAARLAGGRIEQGRLSFHPGTAAALEGDATGDWSLEWLVHPETLA